MIHAPGTARNISHHTAWSCRPQSQSVLRPCRRSPPRSSRPIRSTCADVPGRLAMAAKVRKGKDSASRNIAGAVWSCQAPFRAPLHPDAGSANTRKWVGGKYIGRPIVRAGMSNRLRGRGVPEGRPGGPRCIRAGGPGSPITRRPSGSGKPSHDEGLPTPAGATKAVRSPPLARAGDGRYRRAAHTEWAAKPLASYRRQQITDPDPHVEAPCTGTWAAGTPASSGRSSGRSRRQAGSSDPLEAGRDSRPCPARHGCH